MLVSRTAKPRVMHRAIALAGIAGAMAEVIWVALLCTLTPLSGEEILRQITASVFPAVVASAWAPALGLLIHVVLGVAVAYAFGVLIWQTFSRRMGAGTTLGTAVLALAAIWAFNFFVLLPVVNAEFIDLMPYAATFVSKALFGIAMAATLNSFEQASQANAAGSAHPETPNPFYALH